MVQIVSFLIKILRNEIAIKESKFIEKPQYLEKNETQWLCLTKQWSRPFFLNNLCSHNEILCFYVQFG